LSRTRPRTIESAEPATVAHLKREALTMALYLAIVLLAVHLALGDETDKAEDLALIWGTSVGLGLAHLFAYDLTAIFAGRGRMTREDALGAWGIAAAAVFTAIAASVPYLLFDDPADASTGSALVLLGLITVTAYSSGRRAGANRSRAFVLTLVAVGVALVVVVIKHSLTH